MKNRREYYFPFSKDPLRVFSSLHTQLIASSPLTSERLCVFLLYYRLYFRPIDLLSSGIVFLILMQHHLHARVVLVVVPHIIIIVIILKLQPTLTFSCCQYQSALQTPITPEGTGLVLYGKRETQTQPGNQQHNPGTSHPLAEQLAGLLSVNNTPLLPED